MQIMSAIDHPEQIRAMQATSMAAEIASRWEALHETGRAIAALAALAAEPLSDELAGFPQSIAQRGRSHMQLALWSLEDIDAMTQPGLTALGAIAARGQDVTAPALALWREFHGARAALLALCRDADCAA